jgi:hypothetical protein
MVGFTLEQPAAGEAVLHLRASFRDAPKQIVIHLPWFVAVQSARADGKTVRVADGAISVAPDTKEVRLHWTVKASAPHMSYEHAVADYKAEYARRYQVLMHGEPAAKK